MAAKETMGVVDLVVVLFLVRFTILVGAGTVVAAQHGAWPVLACGLATCVALGALLRGLWRAPHDLRLQVVGLAACVLVAVVASAADVEPFEGGHESAVGFLALVLVLALRGSRRPAVGASSAPTASDP